MRFNSREDKSAITLKQIVFAKAQQKRDFIRELKL